MRYLSKEIEYQSPNPSQGIFKNAFVETEDVEIKDKKELFVIYFHFRYLHTNGQIITLESQPAMFGVREETMVENENGELEEIIAFLSRGMTYSKEIVRVWGRPSFYGVRGYFEEGSVWGDVQLQSANPVLFQIAKDWMDENIYIQGVKIGVNFELVLNEAQRNIIQNLNKSKIQENPKTLLQKTTDLLKRKKQS